MTKYIARAPSRKETYHVDPNCQRLNKEPLEKSERYVEWHDMEICSWCDPSKVSHLE